MVDYRIIERFSGYRFGDDGSVWSCWKRSGGQRRVVSSEWMRLKLYTSNCGYFRVVLYVSGRPFGQTVHALICEAFHGPRPEGMVVCHGPGSRTDNRSINLRWGTRKENEADKYAHGKQHGPRGEQHGNARLTEVQVLDIKRRLADGREFHKTIAADYGVTRQAIGRIADGSRWRHVLLDDVLKAEVYNGQ